MKKIVFTLCQLAHEHTYRTASNMQYMQDAPWLTYYVKFQHTLVVKFFFTIHSCDSYARDYTDRPSVHVSTLGMLNMAALSQWLNEQPSAEPLHHQDGFRASRIPIDAETIVVHFDSQSNDNIAIIFKGGPHFVRKTISSIKCGVFQSVSHYQICAHWR